MSWLLITIISYFLFAIVALIDKYLLIGPIPNPKLYASLVGISRILILVFVPFIGLDIPNSAQLILSLLAGGTFICALFWLFKALQLFEPSRIVPAVGGLAPIFSMALIYLFSGREETLRMQDFSAFILLVLGSFLITYQKSKKISLSSLKISILAAFFLALFFVLAKYVYLGQSFFQGLIWISVGSFLGGLLLLLNKEVRKGLFTVKTTIQKKTAVVFFSNQIMGASAHVLQNWAIALAPLIYVAAINALQGVQYVFLLFFTIFLSLKFPQIIKEEISKKILLQKISAILLIGIGLAMLAFK